MTYCAIQINLLFNLEKSIDILQFLYLRLGVYQEINRRSVFFYTNIFVESEKNINFAIDYKLN